MSSTNGDQQPVKLSLPLKYQQELFQELRQKNELVLLARGLGLLRLVTNLLHSYDAAGNSLILVVGAEERENGWIGEALAEHAAISRSSKARGLSVVNTDLTSVETRRKMYEQGGIFSITSRILVVDLLVRLMPTESIAGVVVLHADKVVATSLEAFILRIYRQGNKVGFLKAFSDNPESFTTGFAPLATMMRNMFLKSVSLWPRFHIVVAQALEGKKKAEVIELEVGMSASMREIQQAIMDCVESSISELRKANTGLEMEDWNVDSALHRQFDMVVRRQLDPVWHRVSWKTKQIVNDLTVLRGMLHSLLTYDAVLFQRHLDTIHAAYSPPAGSIKQDQSPWLMTNAAEIILTTAKNRVYSGKVANGTTDMDALRPVLEEQPKWSVLAEVLEEIDRELYFNPVGRDDSNGTILIMCTDTAQCRQIREYLQTMYVRSGKAQTRAKEDEDEEDEEDEPSAGFMMRRKLRNYLAWKSEFAKIRTALFTENQNILNGTSTTRPTSNSYRGKPSNKRRRERGGGHMAAVSTRAANGAIQVAEDKPLGVANLISEIRPTGAESAQKEDIIADPLDNMEDFYQLYNMQDLVVVHAYDGDMDEHILEEVKPRYIIMYEPDTAFVRRIEVYRSSHNDRNVRVFFLYYGGSVEEQRYLSAVRREKDAFTKLIKEKAGLAISFTSDLHGIEDPQEKFLRTVNTRIAGGGRLAATAEPPRVVVDVREFRSSLPSLLHGRSMVIVPCMLTVGDYILSPNICVERKSIKDLISSFKDGRLYSQAETMLLHYKSPMLLIEFDQDSRSSGLLLLTRQPKYSNTSKHKKWSPIR